MSRFFGSKHGKRQNIGEHEVQVLLTSYKPLTDTLQPPLTSLTDSDDHQSASESARNSKLSTDSVGSDMGRKFSHSSSSKHSQQDTGELLSLAAHNSDITENSNSKVPCPGTDVSLPQMVGCGLMQSSYSIGELTPVEQPMPSVVDTPRDIQTNIAFQPQSSPKQKKMRHFSDSKMTRPRRSHTINKQDSIKSLQQNNIEAETTNLGIPLDIQQPRRQHYSSVYSIKSSSSGYSSRSLSPSCPRKDEPTASSQSEIFRMNTSEQQKTDSQMTKHWKTEVSPITEGELLNTVAVKSQENHSRQQQTKLRKHVAEEQEISELLSIDCDKLPEQVKLHIISLKAENEELKRQLSQNKPKSGYNSLIGVEVIGEVELVVTNKGMSFPWEHYGLRLQIPENALPEGISEYLVNIKVSLAGQFKLPEGYELVSAVYWVTTPGKFTKQVKIEAQHCANFSNPSQLHFIRASCTQKSLPYKFKVVDGGSFTLGSKYGALSTTRFSGNGIAKEVAPGEHSCQYCAQVYFTVKHLKNYWYYCHFVVTKDMEVCLTAVKRKYRQEYDIATSITFGSDHIALDIPEDGVMADNGWQIEPVHKARIKKDQVDGFSSEKIYIPECVLLLKWQLKDKVPDPLDYKVKLLETGEDNFFRIVHNPEPQPTSSPNRNPSVAEGSPVDEPQVGLTINDVLEVTNYLLDLTQTDIHNLGLTLGLNHPHLKRMASSETFRDDMIAAWLQKEDQVTKRGVPTWETLVKALRDRRVNQAGVADKIETKKM